MLLIKFYHSVKSGFTHIFYEFIWRHIFKVIGQRLFFQIECGFFGKNRNSFFIICSSSLSIHSDAIYCYIAKNRVGFLWVKINIIDAVEIAKYLSGRYKKSNWSFPWSLITFFSPTFNHKNEPADTENCICRLCIY